MVRHRFVSGAGRNRPHGSRADSACHMHGTPIGRGGDRPDTLASTTAGRRIPEGHQRRFIAMLVMVAAGSNWLVACGNDAVDSARDPVEQGTHVIPKPGHSPAASARTGSNPYPHRTVPMSAAKALAPETQSTDAWPMKQAHPVIQGVVPAGFVLLPGGSRPAPETALEAQVQPCPPGKRRVVPHVASAEATSLLSAATRSLREAGFEVSSEEMVPADRMPRQTDLRYFRRSEQQGADDASSALARSGVGRLAPKYIEGYEHSISLRPCHYELWLVAPDVGARS